MRNRGVRRARLIATEACRMASNAEHFIGRVSRRNRHGARDRRSAYGGLSSPLPGCAALAGSRGPFRHRLRHWWRNRRKSPGSTDAPALPCPTHASGSVPGIQLPVGVNHPGRAPWRHRGRSGEIRAHASRKSLKCSRPLPWRPARRQSAPEFHLLGTSGTVTTLGGIFLKLPPLRSPPGRRALDDEPRDRDLRYGRSRRPRLRGACGQSLWSDATVRIWCWPAAPFSKGSAGPFPHRACALPIVVCARVS